MYKIIDYYDEFDPKNTKGYPRGSVWWACAMFPFNRPDVTRFFMNKPTEMVNVAKYDFTRDKEDERSGTKPGEFLAISKFKKRPVIVLSTSGSQYRDRAWHGGEFYTVAPLRTLRSHVTGEYKANPDFVWDTITYKYNSVFYLPEELKYGFRESAIQLDRIITLHKTWLIESWKAKLSQEALGCLNAWIHNYFFGTTSKKFLENLEAYREMMGEDPKIRSGLLGRRNFKA